ncbi:TadE family type IV pilus minor pilin [Ornithinimicrobium cavernae]|uniref:TadE family type IV pilus minor pilin n=1 Tax=Ornithinimicrobium cavernae TaxID=2666047 RepID=UPI000D69768C|nr:TadE family type IV pilus minor pilin [Ornithinimicrobium cavernae]
MATAELAIVIPALVAVLALCLSGLGLAIDQIQTVDAARIAARAAARGEPVDAVRGLAEQAAPDGSEVTISRSDDRVRVTVTAPPRTRYLPALPRASASVEVLLEPAARMGSP